MLQGVVSLEPRAHLEEFFHSLPRSNSMGWGGGGGGQTTEPFLGDLSSLLVPETTFPHQILTFLPLLVLGWGCVRVQFG